jgi:hypothetical protein
VTCGDIFCLCAVGGESVEDGALRLRPAIFLCDMSTAAVFGLGTAELFSSLWSCTLFMWSKRLYLRGKPLPGSPRSHPV